MTLILFAAVVYALCFLAADARIFGADTTAYNSITTDNGAVSAEDFASLRDIGALPLRQYALRWNFLRKHLSCYFCMGVWAGPAAHIFLWHFYKLQAMGFAQEEHYILQHPATAAAWGLGCAYAWLLGSVCSYAIDTVLRRLEGA